jgi:hypothetical protein
MCCMHSVDLCSDMGPTVDRVAKGLHSGQLVEVCRVRKDPGTLFFAFRHWIGKLKHHPGLTLLAVSAARTGYSDAIVSS